MTADLKGKWLLFLRSLYTLFLIFCIWSCVAFWADFHTAADRFHILSWKQIAATFWEEGGNQCNVLPFLDTWPNSPFLCFGDVKPQVLEYQEILWLIFGIDLQSWHSRYPLLSESNYLRNFKSISFPVASRKSDQGQKTVAQDTKQLALKCNGKKAVSYGKKYLFICIFSF